RDHVLAVSHFLSSFHFNATSPAEISTLSLHDALPIYVAVGVYGYLTTLQVVRQREFANWAIRNQAFLRATLAYSELLRIRQRRRSEEHTSELQSRENLVCRLLLEKKKKSRDTTCCTNA